MPDFEKTLIIVRHAHRDTTHRELDNGLSEKGKKQADAVASHLYRVFGTKEFSLKSSPKLRCQETLLPFSKLCKSTLEIEELLNEQEDHESRQEFLSRIEKVYESWLHEYPILTAICSHGDWIPEFCQIAFNQNISLERGGLLEAKLVGNRALIFELKQRLP